MQIFIVKDGAQTGPFTKNQIDEMLSSGMISRDVMAWKEGVSDWQPLHTILSAPPPLPLPQSSNETVSETVNPNATALDGPKGVGGWLRFFCVGITILGPIHSLRQFSEARMDEDTLQAVFEKFPALKSADMVENIALIAMMVYGIIVGGLIWSGRPNGRSLARQYLLIRLMICIILPITELLLTKDLPSKIVEAMMPTLIGGLFVNLVSFAIWWTYFKVSKRVRNTYLS